LNQIDLRFQNKFFGETQLELKKLNLSSSEELKFGFNQFLMDKIHQRSNEYRFYHSLE
jgi:hypothetical protein